MEGKSKNMTEIQQLVESAISDQTRADIGNILERISLLKAPERLLLYMRLPSGTPETDPLRQPQNPLGTRSEINHTINWVRSHLEHDLNVSIPKQDVYDDYFSYCTRINIKPLSTADFGKVMKQVFPTIRPRRLGTRGNSRYCYAALRKTTRLTVPAISLPGSQSQSTANDIQETDKTSSSVVDSTFHAGSEADRIIREWASKMLHVDFSSTKDLAEYITANQLAQNNNNHINNRNPKVRSTVKTATIVCTKEKNSLQTIDLSSTNLPKKRRKKTQTSTETSRAASPVTGDAPPIMVLKTEPSDSQQPPPIQYSPKNLSTSTGVLSNAYSTVVNNRVIISPMSTTQIKTELIDSQDSPLTPLRPLSADVISETESDQFQSLILCKKVRQAQQSKELYAQRALNLETNPIDVETSLMRPPINHNSAQIRSNNFTGPDNLTKQRSIASQLSAGEKGDVSTDIIIPRERVISICNLDKDALDDYLNGGDNSQDQELLKYFQPDENAQNMTIEQSRSVSVVDNNNYNEPIDDQKVKQRIGYDKNITELRNYLHQNLSQTESASFRGHRSIAPHDPKMDVMHGFASATLSQMSINNRAIYQPKHGDHSSSVASPCFLPETNLLSTISESNLISQSTNNNNNHNHHTNIPQSPNSRRKNFSFVPISPGPESPSSGPLNVNVCSSSSQQSVFNQTPFISPKSASHRKLTKSTVTNSIISQKTHYSSTEPYPKMLKSSNYGRNHNVAISAPPSPSSLLHLRQEHQANQIKLADPMNMQTMESQYDGNSSELFGNRSQSAPLHCQMQNGNPLMFSNATSMSSCHSPIANEYNEYMDIVGSSSNELIPKLEPPIATDLTTTSNSSLRANHNPMNENLPNLHLPNNNQDSHQFIGQNMSRSVPSTPQPSRFFSTTAMSSSMAMYDISKSVPTTPLGNGFHGTGTPFRYSPSGLNRDFLINGNTVETLCDNSMTSTFFTSGQHSLDHADQNNSNLSERDLRLATENIEELSGFGNDADPIIGSDLLNQL